MIKIYTAQAMTGRSQDEIVAYAKHAKKVFEGAGIVVLDPVLTEHIKDEKKLLTDKPVSILKDYWKRDKTMIREAHVIVDLSPELKSEGVAHEIGYGRYHLWMPIVRVYKPDSKPASLIAVFEDDLIVHSLEEAAIQINKYWGSWSKRFMWRLSVYNRCFLKACYYKLLKWL
jgi:hypothetical protein